MRQILILMALISIPAIASSKTIHVPGDYNTIQEAINAAVNGDTVLVAPGTYIEIIDFIGKAITVKSEQGADVTRINGKQAGSAVTYHYGEGADSVLDGFTLKKSKNNIIGGGISCYSSSPTIMNNTITGNSADFGGGIGCRSSSPTIKNNTITGNSADFGSGISCDYNSSPTITNNTISGNSAVIGGGIYCYSSSPSIAYNTITGNTGYDSGGGLFCRSSSPAITNNSITGNWADIGGGVCCFDSSPTDIANNSFSWNSAFSNGGGMYNSYCDLNVNDCSFSGNLACIGGGMFNRWGSSLTVTNCTFFQNSAIDDGGGMCNFDNNSTVTNTVLWNNDASEGPEIWIGKTAYPTTLTLSYSDVKGGQSSVYVDPGCTLNWGPGMIDSDPLLVDSLNGDFHLTFNSPCRDSGDNSAVTELTDFEGDPRIAYGTVDIGADEFYTHLYWTGDATPGGNVEIKFVGLPGTAPVGLCIGTGVLDPPIPSMWGDWYLQYGIIGPVDLGKIPSPNGVLVIPGTIPGSPPPPYSIPMQALIGAELSNLSILEVQ